MTLYVLAIGLLIAAIAHSVVIAIITLAIIAVMLYARQNWLHDHLEGRDRVHYDTEDAQ